MDTTLSEVNLDAWCSVLGRTDSIFAGENIDVGLADENYAPAWSDGQDIFLSRSHLHDVLAEAKRQKDMVPAILCLKGLNYHELCHILFTPRASHDLPRWVRDQQKAGALGVTDKWWYAFNALEDQRIETLFTARYRSTQRYFESTILEWIVKNGGVDTATLIYGRKYLPLKLRVTAGNVFRKARGGDDFKEMKSIIDEYLTLRFGGPTTAVNRAKLLITRYVELIKQQNMPPPPITDNGVRGQSDAKIPSKTSVVLADRGRTQVRKGRVDKNAEQDAMDAVLDVLGSEDDSEDVSDEDVTDSDDDSLQEQIEDMVSTAAQARDDIEASVETQADAKMTLDAVRAMAGREAGSFGGEPFAPTYSADARGDTATASRRIAQLFTRIRQEADAEVLLRENSGRVDLRRAVTRRPHETNIFRRWDQGAEDLAGVEVVILCDTSPSMASCLPEVSQTLWALKHAFDKADIRCSVVLFNTGHKVLFQPGEKVINKVPILRDRGGTDPTSALDAATSVLLRSRQKSKVLVTITDGAWTRTANNDDTIMKLGKSGVHTMLIGFDDAVAVYGDHDHQEAHDVKNVGDVTIAVTKLVARIMKQVVQTV